MRKWIRLLASLAVIFLLFQTTVFAEKEQSIKMQVESGIDGKAKREKGFPVTITLTNEGNDFSGELLITVSPTYQSAGNIVLPVELAKGTTKKIETTIPGDNEQFSHLSTTSDFKQLRLYEGNHRNGKLIAAKEQILPRILQDDTTTIGVWSGQADALNYLKVINLYGNSAVFSLKKEIFPGAGEGLETLDFIVLNQVNPSELSEEEQNALKEWIAQGGQLIIGSEAGMEQKYGSLQNILPMKNVETNTVSSLQALETVATQQMPSGDYTVYEGTLGEGTKVLYESNGIPLVIQKKLGLGAVTQVNYNIANPVINQWSGNEKWWETLLQNLHTNHMNQRYNQHFYEMQDASQFFKTFSNLSFPLIIVAFIIYTIVVAPALYIGLKKFDKREWAWVVIPCVALVTSVGIFLFGASERLHIRANEVSILSLDGQGNGVGAGAVGMFTNGAGHYDMNIVNENSVLQTGRPVPHRVRTMNSPEQLEDFAFIERTSNGYKTTFEDVEFWSIRSQEYNIPLQQIGKFDTALTLKNGKAEGSIANSLPMSFEQVYLMTGSHYYEIGPLEKDGKKDFSFSIKGNESQFFSKPLSSTAVSLFPNVNRYGQQDISVEERKKFTLTEGAFQRRMYADDGDGPLLVAYSSSPLVSVEIDGKEVKRENTHLVTQPVEMDVEYEGDFTVRNESLTPSITPINGQVLFNGLMSGEKFLHLEQGTYEISYQLPNFGDSSKVAFKQLKVRYPKLANSVGYTIYNKNTDAYEPLDDNTHSHVFTDKAAQYITNNGQVKLRLEQRNKQDEVQLPFVTVEGTIAQ
ncbi:hypothetical protein LC040_09740 [Bacillus tianshenii]|nr:hypothetical protein LC040_09740 [Bacillus tianshenii]